MIEAQHNINSPVRRIKAKAELFNGSALVNTFNHNDHLKSVTVERVGEGKFFGFGICQKLNIHLIDKDRKINTTTDNSLRVYISAQEDYIDTFPTFYITENHRSENTNELSITAYDALYGFTERFINEVDITAPYTLNSFLEAICAVLGCSWNTNAPEAFNLAYTSGANIEGTENIREILNAIAEATQTIYYIDRNNNLYFKRLDKDGSAVLTISKADYFTLDSKDNRRLTTIASVTQLGENISATMDITGTTQYIRDNPFFELRPDIESVVEEALASVGGLTINQFNCNWRSNYLLEIGDKIELITKDNKAVYSYLLDETISYDGALNSAIGWSYEDNDTETEANPSSLGEALKYTYAKVDKANKQIDIVVSDVRDLTHLQLTTEGLLATVESSVDDLNQKVAQTISAEDVRIEIQNELNNGVDKVITNTGFIFNDDGLIVSKTGSEMTTQITEDGMKVNRDNNEVLTADNTGVKAENLHATTYLIVGENSRFEDFAGRSGCFWIG